MTDAGRDAMPDGLDGQLPAMTGLLAGIDVDRAREMFFTQGLDPGEWVVPHISRSWRRCHSSGGAMVDFEPVVQSQLRDRREQSMRLLECAQPELDFLSDHALGSGCVVILSDASGMILDEIGSADFLPKAERVALTPGVLWSESSRGTNAIGTALMERRPLMVLGREHYLSQNGGLGCAAAPIFTGRGDVAGVLDISGEQAHVSQHALGLVRLAAQQVEHRMMLAEASGHLLRFHVRPSLLGTAREGLLVIDDGRLVGANRVALDLLGSEWNDLLDTSIERLIGLRWTRLRQGASLITLPDGQQIAASVEPSMQRPGTHRFMKRTTATQTPSSIETTAPMSTEADSPADAHGRAHLRTHVPSGAQAEASADADSQTDVTAHLLARAVKVVNDGLPVLVTGETGSGKEVFARKLHAASNRSSGPFVTVNCAALPETLIEAELFGYEAGAFTGARRHGMPGRIRQAQGGVLFLDEIGDMPLALQTRLLRVVEDKVVTPLGASHGTAIDFELVCATHRSLDAMALEGTFRSDLRYRINGFEVHLPALRERSDRRALIDRLFGEFGSPKHLKMDEAFRQALEAFPWPGNVRELCAVLRTCVALAEAGDTLSAAGLPAHIRDPHAAGAITIGVAGNDTAGEPPRALPASPHDDRPDDGHSALLSKLEHDAIDKTLADCAGNIAEAARRLGIHRSTLYRRTRGAHARGEIGK